MRYQFGEFELVPDLYELRRGGKKVAIEPRVLELLTYLVANRERVIPKDELIEKVWAQEFVTDSVLTRAAGQLRKVLDDSAREPRFIQTVYGRGYAFVGSLDELPDKPAGDQSHSPGGLGTPAKGRSAGFGWRRSRYAPRIVIGLVVAGLVALFLFASGRDGGSSTEPSILESEVATEAATPLPSVAVLPLRRLTSDAAFDHIQVAVPSEVAMLLYRVPTLSVRPFTASLSVVGEHPGPQAAGRELRATYVIGGQYLMAGEKLRVTLEAIEVERNAVVWTETVSALASDEIALMAGLEEAVSRGLVPFLGAAVASARTAPRPRNLEAYSLFLRALAQPQNGEPNQVAISMLDSSVKVDPGYAPAWAELSRRLELDALYGDGGLQTRARSREALALALELDPDLVPAVVREVMLRTDNGDLEEAFALAQELVDRRPESALAHFARGYVYRFAGLLELSVEDCERALALDPANPRWRSCAATMAYLGRTERMWKFAELDDEPIWTAIIRGNAALGKGEAEEALQYFREIPEVAKPWHLRALLVEAYVNGSPDLEDVAARAIETQRALPTDVEDRLTLAAFLAACDLDEEALSMARWAVEGGFCAGAGLRHPVFDGLRSRAEFQRILVAAETCTARFRDYRARSLAGSA